MTNNKAAPVAVFVVLCLIWGSTWLFIKIGLEDAPPVLSAGMRFLIAAAILFPVMQAKGLKLPADRKVLAVMVYTGFFAISIAYGLVYWGEQYIPAGLAAVLFSTFPFFVMILSHFRLADDRLNTTKILGATVGFAGVGFIFLDRLDVGGPGAGAGIAAVIVSAMCAAVGNVEVKRHVKSLNPLILTVVQMTCGAVALLIIGLLVEDVADFRFSLRTIGSLFYLAILGSCVAFISYYWLIKRIKITTASLIVFVIPIVALLLDWLVLDQRLNWQVAVGSCFVIGGIWVARR